MVRTKLLCAKHGGATAAALCDHGLRWMVTKAANRAAVHGSKLPVPDTVPKFLLIPISRTGKCSVLKISCALRIPSENDAAKIGLRKEEESEIYSTKGQDSKEQRANAPKFYIK